MSTLQKSLYLPKWKLQRKKEAEGLPEEEVLLAILLR